VTVRAQTGNRIAAGVAVSPARAADEASRGDTGIGLLWRLGHGNEGWGWKYGFGWYSADLDRQLDATRLEFGALRVRPILAGYGYSHTAGRAQISAGLLAGYAFNSFRPLASFRDAYRQRLGAQQFDAEVSNSLVLKPQLSTWIDLSRRIGLNLDVGYAISRPTMTISSSLGRERRKIRADMLIMKVGAVYSIF
jgi:hypothetical protein